MKRIIKRICEIVVCLFKTSYVVLRSYIYNCTRKRGNRLYDYIPGDRESLFVLGNGPSLKDVLGAHCEKLTHENVICVNAFVSTDTYEIIRPSYYILADPTFFMYETDDLCRRYPKEIIEKVNATIEDLVSKTNWPLVLYLSSYAEKNEGLKNKLKENINIRTVYYCGLGMNYKNVKKQVYYSLARKDMICFPFSNVVQQALCIGVFYEYKNICLIGADSSWIEDVYIDDKNNDIKWKYHHFYSTDEHKNQNQVLEIQSIYNSKMAGFLSIISSTFEIYGFIKDYASYNKINIYNCSNHSWIDVFERRTIEEMLNVY